MKLGDRSARAEKETPRASKTTWLWYVAAVALAILLDIYLVSLRKTQNEAQQYAALAFNIERIEQSLYRMEGANNGFLLTANDAYRSDFNAHRDIVSDNYREVARMTDGNAGQSAQMKRFKEKLTKWFDVYNPLIVARRANAQEPRPENAGREDQRKSLSEAKSLFSEMLASLDEVRARETDSHAPQKSGEAWSFQIFGQEDYTSRGGEAEETDDQ